MSPRSPPDQCRANAGPWSMRSCYCHDSLDANCFKLFSYNQVYNPAGPQVQSVMAWTYGYLTGQVSFLFYFFATSFYNLGQI